MNLLQHLAHVDLLPASTSRGAYYEARCSCGWIGAARATMRASYADLDRHEADYPLNSHDNQALGRSTR